MLKGVYRVKKPVASIVVKKSSSNSSKSRCSTLKNSGNRSKCSNTLLIEAATLMKRRTSRTSKSRRRMTRFHRMMNWWENRRINLSLAHLTCSLEDQMRVYATNSTNLTWLWLQCSSPHSLWLASPSPVYQLFLLKSTMLKGESSTCLSTRATGSLQSSPSASL